jgi:site-specific DNA-methyltransferase (adenine-specific)
MELKLVEVGLLDDHPKNPRVVMRDDVIDAIATQIADTGVFSQKHALHVRPLGERYQILAGHHRKHASIKAGVIAVWCWVEEMDDESAFMSLVLSNSQGELDPLEIGIHAFEAVPLSKGGRGKKGGLSEYAAKVGRSPAFVTAVKDAGEVAKTIQTCEGFIGRAYHLSAIHKLPREAWQAACQWLTKSEAPVQQVKDLVSRVSDCIDKAGGATWFPSELLFYRCSATPDFSGQSVAACVAIVAAAKATIEDADVPAEKKAEAVAAIDDWISDNVASDAWNRRKLQARCDEVLGLLAVAEEVTSDSWCCGDWRDHLEKIENESVRLMLIDPPYGMDYQSNRRDEKHDKIGSDEGLTIAANELYLMAQDMFHKMEPDSHVLCFCRWDSEPWFAERLEAAGLTVKGSLIWVKDNHGSGDLKGGFAPKHERIIHAVKGTPTLYERHPDVFVYAKESSKDHPTEKPVDLLRKLIQCTTVRGQLVVDTFAGVGSTCVAAAKEGRRWFGCELQQEYYDIGSRRLRGLTDE